MSYYQDITNINGLLYNSTDLKKCLCNGMCVVSNIKILDVKILVKLSEPLQ